MATNQYNTGGYGFNPLDPRAQFMTNDARVNAVSDPYLTKPLGASDADALRGGMQGSINNQGMGGLMQQGQPALPGSVSGGTGGFFGAQDASWLGGAGGPNAVGNTMNPMSANDAWKNYATNNQDLLQRDPNAFRIGQNQAYENAQRALQTSGGAGKPEFTVQGGNYRGPDFNTLLNQAKQQGQGALIDRLRQQYAGYGQNPTDSNNAFNTLGGAETFISSLANGAGQGATFGNDQRQQAQIDAMLANQLAYGGTSNSHMNQGFLDSLNQNQYQAPREDPFAGQNLNDASVQFQMKQYMQTHPDFVPVNTYKGEAPRLPGQINQDTGQMTTDQGSYNPWAGNKGFVQQMPWQNQQQQPQAYQPQQQTQQQSNPYLQPFQQTQQYQKAMNTNYASQNQPQAQSYWGNQGAFGNGTQNNNFQSPFQQNSGFGRNQFQTGGQQQGGGGLLGGGQYGKNKYGLLG